MNKIYSVCWNITEKCNESCEFCYRTIVNDLSLEERKLIGRSWFQNNQKRLISCYLYDLLTDNRESIKRTDIHFLNANLSNLKR